MNVVQLIAFDGIQGSLETLIVEMCILCRKIDTFYVITKGEENIFLFPGLKYPGFVYTYDKSICQ